jgi:leukotriene-A4 hydrolase
LVISITYETNPGSTALQWLDPLQTSGKKFPFLFSQSQAIHARSFFPCQDTPFVKFTYSSCVNVRKPLVGLMSALLKETIDVNEEIRQYKFEQPIRVPSYLVAIAAGALDNRQFKIFIFYF